MRALLRNWWWVGSTASVLLGATMLLLDPPSALNVARADAATCVLTDPETQCCCEGCLIGYTCLEEDDEPGPIVDGTGDGE